MVGYVNWQRNRRRFLHDGVIDAIVADMKANAPDHIAVTGDLVNLALDREIELARLWLETLGDPHDVSVVPGNHDAYVPGALDKRLPCLGPVDERRRRRAAPVDRHSFPYLRVRGKRRADRRDLGARHRRRSWPTASSAKTSRTGSARMLDAAGRRGLFRVVMIHHPPVRNAVPQHKRLFGIGNFQKIVRRPRRRAGAARPFASRRRCTGSTAARARCRWSASPRPARRRAARKPAAQYNLFDIDGEPGAWSRAADPARADRRRDAARARSRASSSMPPTPMEAVRS